MGKNIKSREGLTLITRGIYIREGKLVIHGRWYMDGREEKWPAIIICHEFGTNMHSTARYAKILCRQGYAVFIFDFCGSESGTSQGRKSTEMSVTTEVVDLLKVIDYVESRPFVNNKHIFLMGCSQGGLVASLAAEKRKNEIEKLVLLYPALSIPDDARKGSMLDAEFHTDEIPETFVVMKRFNMGKRYMADAIVLSEWKEMMRYKNPVLIVHGTDDELVDIDYARKAAKIFPNAKLVEIDGGHHLFPTLEERKLAVEETIKFLWE